MQKLKIKDNGLILLIILAGLLFFFKLGSFSLYDAAETTYGEFIKQIRLTGDWLTLHYNGEIIFDKPPLYFWLANLASFVFGFNEFAIRFWAALCGVLSVVVTYFLGLSFYNKRTGFFAGLIAMTAFQFLVQSRIAELDIVLTLLINFTLLCFWQGYYRNKRQWYFWAYLAMAAATLLKGIIGLAIPAVTVFLFLLSKKELYRLKELQLGPGALIFLVLASPWYVAEWAIHGQKFTQFILGFLFLSRFGAVVSGHPGPWYYYFLALLLGFAPWSQFLPYALSRTWKNREFSPELLTLCFIIPVFIVFSLAKTKLPSYILPIYPFLAIAVAKFWDDFLTYKSDKRLKWMLISQLSFTIIILLLILGFIILGTTNYQSQYQDLMPNLTTLAGILVAGGICSITFFFLKEYNLSFTSLPIMVFALAFILTTQTLPAVEKYKGTKELAGKVAAGLKREQLIAAFAVGNRPGVVFYNVKPIVFLENEQQLFNFLKKKEGYVFTTKEQFNSFTIKPPVFARQGELVVIY